MCSISCLFELKLSPTGNNFFAEKNETFKNFLKSHLLRPSRLQSEHIHTKGGLKGGLRIKPIENDFRNRIFFQFNINADPIAIRFIAEVRNSFKFFVINELCDALNHFSFVDLIRNFRNDNSFTIFTNRFNMGATSYDKRPTPCFKGAHNTTSSHNQSPRWKIRAWDILH